MKALPPAPLVVVALVSLAEARAYLDRYECTTTS